MIITRTSKPFGRAAPQPAVVDALSGIGRIAKESTKATFQVGYGYKRLTCSGIAQLSLADGTECGAAGGAGSTVYVGRSNGYTYEIPKQIGSGGGGASASSSAVVSSAFLGRPTPCPFTGTVVSIADASWVIDITDATDGCLSTGEHTVEINSGTLITGAPIVGSSVEVAALVYSDGTVLATNIAKVNPSARFYYPAAVATDSDGNIYVADSYNNTIRKVTPGGVVTTLAGLASYGVMASADGTGSAARFYLPLGLAIDGAGNVYVTDTGNFTIRKIASGGVVTTLAGSAGNNGSADGTGSAARFDTASGIASDSDGNVYVADTGNHTIRKITPSGVVTTLAGSVGSHGSGDGTGSAARFYYPYGIAIDSDGNIYVADKGNSTIRKIAPGGVVTTLAGLAESTGSADGTGSGARFSSPYGLAVDSAGNVYVADTANFTIRKITSVGVVTTLAGSAGSYGYANGIGSAAQFAYPGGLAVNSGGDIYEADYSHTIRKITSAGVVTTLAGVAWDLGSSDS